MKILKLVIAYSMFLALLGCSPSDAEKAAQNLGFETNGILNKFVGDQFTNPAIGLGTGVITYTSSDLTSATVSSAGTVTILKAGQTTITATITESEKYKSATATYTIDAVKNDQIVTLTPIFGKVIDGYVSGATVFLDMNFNGTADFDEPSGITIEDGSFVLDLTDLQKSCLGFAPIVANVPVGAYDDEHGTVVKPYSMVMPPRGKSQSTDLDFYITPLTSIIWQSYLYSQRGALPSNNCLDLLTDANSQLRIEENINRAIVDMTAHYNISEANLFADFVADNNTFAHATAINIVKGLVKSVEEMDLLKEQYPNADWLHVEYHQWDYRDADELYPDAWYREFYYSEGNHMTTRLSKISDDLTTEIKVIIEGESDHQYEILPNGDRISYGMSAEFESRNGDGSGYSCDSKESISLFDTTNSIEFESTILLDAWDASDITVCQNLDFSNAVSHYAFVSDESDPNVRFVTQFMYGGQDTVGVFPGVLANSNTRIEDWMNTDWDAYKAHFVSLPSGWDDLQMGGARFVGKGKIYLEGENEIMELKSVEKDDSETVYVSCHDKRTKAPDGTTTSVIWDDQSNLWIDGSCW